MQPLPVATNRLAPQARCARELLDAVPQVMWFVRRQMRGHRGGLSLPQFRALLRIDRQPDANLSTIAEHLGVSLPSASRMVTGLVDRGFLIRHGRRNDRRQMALVLTARGSAVLRAARRASQQSVESQLSALASTQRKTIMEAMGILKKCFASRWEPPELPAEMRSKNGNGNRS